MQRNCRLRTVGEWEEKKKREEQLCSKPDLGVREPGAHQPKILLTLTQKARVVVGPRINWHGLKTQ